MDWERLTTSGTLSSTERATAQIARGCATLERAGGAPALAPVVVATVTAVDGGAR